jgi:hypothetical protein
VKAIDTVREVLKKFEPDHEFWFRTVLNPMSNPPRVEGRYKNPELRAKNPDFAGEWVFGWPVTVRVVRALFTGGYLERDLAGNEEGEVIFKLKKNVPRPG